MAPVSYCGGPVPLRRLAVEIKHDLSVLINLNLTHFFCNVEDIFHNTPGLHEGTERVVSDSYRLKPPQWAITCYVWLATVQ